MSIAEAKDSRAGTQVGAVFKGSKPEEVNTVDAAEYSWVSLEEELNRFNQYYRDQGMIEMGESRGLSM